MATARLKSSRDFSRVYRGGRVSRQGALLIRSKPNHLALSRVGVVVSRKVSKSSVRRNRLRRQLIEHWRKNTGSIREGYDVILTVTTDREHTPDEIAAALDRAGLLKGHSK